MADSPQPRLDPRLFAIMVRQDAYKDLFKAGKIDGFEFFCLWDPFEHVAFPDLSPTPPDEVEFQKTFSARLDRFFDEESPSLPSVRIQERLDEIVKEELVKKHGVEEPWTLLRRSIASSGGGKGKCVDD